MELYFAPRFLKAQRRAHASAFAFPRLRGRGAMRRRQSRINAWVRIAPDGTVTILSTGAEMGQGSMTSLPLIVAEEMDADWSKVKVEWAPADPTIYGYTFQNAKAMAIVGSRAVMLYYNDLRIAGAQVRKVLLANAAEKWGVEPLPLKTEPGFVVDPAPAEARLRRDRLVRASAVAAARGREERAEGQEPVPADRQADAAARHAAQGKRHGAIRDRRRSAGHGVRDRAAFAGARRRAGELERRQGEVDDAACSARCGCPTASAIIADTLAARDGRAQRARSEVEKGRGRRASTPRRP